MPARPLYIKEIIIKRLYRRILNAKHWRKLPCFCI
uniref:Uncharacterized protein n=1 Tax=Rhizophora mucronata TaxID=61149 RepID=A0A2P2PVA7_RHIMU